MVSSLSSSAVDVATTNTDSPTRGPRTSDPSSPPTVITTVLQDGEKMPVEPPPLSSAADPTSPQPQPQPQSQPEPEPEPGPEREPDPAAIAAEAEKLKEQGNESFKLGRYGEAVDLYTKAISACRCRRRQSSVVATTISLSVIAITIVSPSFLPSPFSRLSPMFVLRRAESLMGNDHI